MQSTRLLQVLASEDRIKGVEERNAGRDICEITDFAVTCKFNSVYSALMCQLSKLFGRLNKRSKLRCERGSKILNAIVL